MTKSKKKPIANQSKEKGKLVKKIAGDSIEDDSAFDFGGFPKNVSLKKNIGCGG